jgi:uncharacterized membrane protein YdcZ (DUF606 family)
MVTDLQWQGRWRFDETGFYFEYICCQHSINHKANMLVRQALCAILLSHLVGYVMFFSVLSLVCKLHVDKFFKFISILFWVGDTLCCLLKTAFLFTFMSRLDCLGGRLAFHILFISVLSYILLLIYHVRAHPNLP